VQPKWLSQQAGDAPGCSWLPAASGRFHARFQSRTRLPIRSVAVRNHPAGQPLSNPGAYSGLKVKKQRMNFQEPEYLLNEPWWVTVMGCVTLTAIFAFALVAV